MKVSYYIFFYILILHTACHHSSKFSISSLKRLSVSPINGSFLSFTNLKPFKALVIVMREKDCPISEKYGPRLAKIEEYYLKKNVKFVFVYVGQVRPERSAKKDLEKFKFKSPYIIDKKQKLIQTLEVKTTGDVFILTPEFKIVYRGPVDDQFHLLKSAIKPKNSYVKTTLEKILSGKKVTPKELPAPGCIISKPLKKKNYFKDIAPVFNTKCLNCHSAGKTLIEFNDYESIYGRRAMVKYVIENNLMPPWNLSEHTGPWRGDPTLSSKEKEMILLWIDDDLPYKDKNIKLNYVNKAETIENPDYTIKLDKPVQIPATGFIPYKRIISIPNFSEDKYLKEVEYIIKSKVIHHVVINILDSSYLPELRNLSSFYWHDAEKFIRGWVVGQEKLQRYFSKNTGTKIPKNSVFVAYIHYDSLGEKLIDTTTQIKFKFHSQTPKYLRSWVRLSDKYLSIPAYHSNYISTSYYKVKKDLLLSSISSHMHLRGKSSSVLIRDLEGNETTIFKLEPYFFNFQNTFHLKSPIRIPKDYTIICRNYFDNSVNNPVNPDPSKNVKNGKYTKDEMSQCYLGFLLAS